MFQLENTKVVDRTVAIPSPLHCFTLFRGAFLNSIDSKSGGLLFLFRRMFLFWGLLFFSFEAQFFIYT